MCSIHIPDSDGKRQGTNNNKKWKKKLSRFACVVNVNKMMMMLSTNIVSSSFSIAYQRTRRGETNVGRVVCEVIRFVCGVFNGNKCVDTSAQESTHQRKKICDTNSIFRVIAWCVGMSYVELWSVSHCYVTSQEDVQPGDYLTFLMNWCELKNTPSKWEWSRESKKS